MLTASLEALERGWRRRPLSPAVPGWFRKRFESDLPMVRFRSGVTRFRKFLFAGLFTLCLATLVWVIWTEGSPRVLEVPIALIPCVAVFLGLWLVRVIAQVPSLAEARTVRRRGSRAFAVGLFPVTRTYVVVDSLGLTVVHGKDTETAMIEWTSISAVGAEASAYGVGLTLSIGNAWYDIPIVLEAGGPSASVWSLDPVSASRRLLAALKGQIQERASDLVWVST